MLRSKFAILLPFFALATTQALACYTVYDRTNVVVYQGEKSPVDMSMQLHDTVPVRFPGGHMVFDESADCRVINSVAQGSGGGRSPTRSPLLTDERTARNMHLAHTNLGGGVALVQPGAAIVPAGLTIVPALPANEVYAVGQSTRTMGAGPDTRTLGAGPGAYRTVITEYNNPPMTTVQRGDGKTVVRELR